MTPVEGGGEGGTEGNPLRLPRVHGGNLVGSERELFRPPDGSPRPPIEGFGRCKSSSPPPARSPEQHHSVATNQKMHDEQQRKHKLQPTSVIKTAPPPPPPLSVNLGACHKVVAIFVACFKQNLCGLHA